MNARIACAATIVAAATVLTGCSREVDVSVTGAMSVTGATGLYRFCDGPVLIYFTKISGSADEYDWYWPGGCRKDAASGRWVFDDRPPTGVVPPGDDAGEN